MLGNNRYTQYSCQNSQCHSQNIAGKKVEGLFKGAHHRKSCILFMKESYSKQKRKQFCLKFFRNIKNFASKLDLKSFLFFYIYSFLSQCPRTNSLLEFYILKKWKKGLNIKRLLLLSWCTFFLW